MKKFFLTILFSGFTDSTTIEALRVDIINDSYVFSDINGREIAYYPVNSTIIQVEQ